MCVLNQRWNLRPDPLEALRDGNPAPFEAFVTAEAGSFRAFYRRLGAAPAEAEDLTQELFLKLFRTSHSYAARDRFAAYAFRVARNAWIDQRRRAGLGTRAAGQAGDGAGDSDGDPLERARADQPDVGWNMEHREEAALVRQALAELPENQRLVFDLGVIQELDYPTIAGILEIPVGTVKSRMFYAVRRLRELCGGDERGSEGERGQA